MLLTYLVKGRGTAQNRRRFICGGGIHFGIIFVSSIINIGRALTSIYILARYSPITPSDSRISPPITKIALIMDG